MLAKIQFSIVFTVCFHNEKWHKTRRKKEQEEWNCEQQSLCVFFSSFHFRLPRSAILLNVQTEMNWKIKPFPNKQAPTTMFFFHLPSFPPRTLFFTFAYKYLFSGEEKLSSYTQLLFFWCHKKQNVTEVVLCCRGGFFHKVAQKAVLKRKCWRAAERCSMKKINYNVEIMLYILAVV